MNSFISTKTYSVVSPSLTGMLSDDYLYFEGVKKPEAIFTLHDNLSHEINESEIDVLSRYSNDLYSLLLRKLTEFETGISVDAEATIKLQALLQELVKVKRLIENASKTAIMGK